MKRFLLEGLALLLTFSLTANPLAAAMPPFTASTPSLPQSMQPYFNQIALQPALIESQFLTRQGNFNPRERVIAVQGAFSGFPARLLDAGLSFQLFGIKTNIHWSVGLGVIFFARDFFPVLPETLEAPMRFFVGALLGAALIFISLWPHEKAHAWAGQRLGYRIKAIHLSIFGGLAELESGEIINSAADEWRFILPGPLMSLFIAGLSWVILQNIPREYFTAWVFTDALMRANTVVSLFNLAPLFPVDGAKLLRSALWARLGLEKATRITIGVTRVGTVLFYLWSTYDYVQTNNPLAIVIGLIISGTLSQSSAAEMRRLGITMSWKPPHWKVVFAVIATIFILGAGLYAYSIGTDPQNALIFGGLIAASAFSTAGMAYLGLKNQWEHALLLRVKHAPEPLRQLLYNHYDGDSQRIHLDSFWSELSDVTHDQLAKWLKDYYEVSYAIDVRGVPHFHGISQDVFDTPTLRVAA